MHVSCKLSSTKSHGWCAVKIATHIGTRNKAKEHILPVHTQHTPPTHPPPTRQKPVSLEKFQLWEWHKGHITLHQGQALNWILMFPLTILDIKKICSTLHTSWWGFWICCYNCGRGEKKPSQNHTTYDSNNHQCCSCWSHVGLGGNIFMSL